MFCCIKETTTDFELGKTISEFAFALILQMDLNAGNIVFSPASIALALSMALAGADGGTKDQMLDVLGCGKDEASTHKAFSYLVKAINAAALSCDFCIANRLYGVKEFEISRRFAKILANKYHSDFIQVDFTDGSVRHEIDKWVAGVTQFRIKGIIPKGLLSDLTRLVLVNAAYFKGIWSDGFSQSFIGTFHVSKSHCREVCMVRNAAYYLYAENQNCQAIQLPYDGDSLCMVIMLPKENVGLAHVVRQLSGQTFLRFISSMQPIYAMVYLPPFSIDSSYSLSQQLKGLGMVDMFSPAANFTRMTTDPVELCVSEVVHKAVVKVNGKGTRGGAAYAKAAEEMDARVPPHDHIVFKADHPFMFSIFHRQLACPLFYGTLIEPEFSLHESFFMEYRDSGFDPSITGW